MTDRKNSSDEVMLQLLNKLNEVVVELREINGFAAASGFCLALENGLLDGAEPTENEEMKGAK